MRQAACIALKAGLDLSLYDITMALWHRFVGFSPQCAKQNRLPLVLLHVSSICIQIWSLIRPVVLVLWGNKRKKCPKIYIDRWIYLLVKITSHEIFSPWSVDPVAKQQNSLTLIGVEQDLAFCISNSFLNREDWRIAARSSSTVTGVSLTNLTKWSNWK